jgi:prepilin-type N-terminal cleavage/methylation domain-containing protein
MKRPLRAGDDGFTLIELLVTVVVVAIIAVPLAGFLFGYFLNSTQTQQRLGDSHDIQIVSAYFSQDVANTGLRAAGTYTPLQSVWKNDAPPPCAPAQGNAVLLLKWDSWDASGGLGSHSVRAAAYVVISGALHRITCSDTTLTSDVTVVHNFVSATVSCSPTPPGCENGTPPATITLTVRVQAGAADQAGQTVTLTGDRRQSTS